MNGGEESGATAVGYDTVRRSGEPVMPV